MKKTLFFLFLISLFAPWVTQAQTPTPLFSANFNGTSLPTDWENESESWTFDASSGFEGSGCAINTGHSSEPVKLITPVINLPLTVSFAKLSFRHRQPQQATNMYFHNRLKVYYKTPSSEDWVLLLDYVKIINDWTPTPEEIELPNLSSSFQIAFECNGNENGGVYLDDVSVEAITRPRPVGLGIEAMTSTTATLGWTERGSANSWEICINGDETHPVEANPFTLEELTTAAPYTVKVRAVYGTDEHSDWSEPISFEMATNKIVIGSGTETSGNLPTTFHNLYSLSEQIYTADELGGAGTVISIDFYCENNTSYECSRKFDIYMKNTNRTRFDDYEWEEVSSANRVYSGNVNFPVGSAWKTITLDTPFEYDGTSNVLIVVYDNPVGFTTGDISCRTFSSSEGYQSRYDFSGDHSYNPTSPPTNGAGSIDPYKNQIRLLKVTCMPPAGLAVSDVTNTSATLSWTERGDATSWVVEYSVNSDFTAATQVLVSGSPTQTIVGLTPLTPMTRYYARVRAVCGQDIDESPWSTTLVFNTDICAPADKCEIFYELTMDMDYSEPMDLAGNGINVVDVVTGFVIARLTIGNYLYDENSGEEYIPNLPEETDGLTYARGSFLVCNDRNIRFEWMNTDDEIHEYCSYVFYDVDYNEILSGVGEMDENNNTYQVDCDLYSCLRPTNLTISEVSMVDATLSWTERNGATSWIVQYAEDAEFTSPTAVQDNMIGSGTAQLTDLSSATTYYVRVKSNCGDDDGVSEWAVSSFTTAICPIDDQCAISYELFDDYGDGWNGNAINVVDATTGIVLDTWTIVSNGSEAEPTDDGGYNSGTLYVCNGREIRFEWVSGGWSEECTYYIYGVNGGNDIIFSGSDAMDDDVTYTPNCHIIGVWYAISAPKYDEEGEGYSIDVDNVGGLLPTEPGEKYDLFRYNEETATWENQKESSTAEGFSTLDCGRGYIYRRSTSPVLSFNGDPYEGDLTEVLTLTSSCTNNDLKGFNLIGNPYQHSIIKGGDFDIGHLLDVGYYSLNGDGSWLAHLDQDPIAVGQGVLVRVSGDDDVDLEFYDSESGVDPNEPTKKNSADRSLQLTVTGGGHKDVAYALFVDREGLHKIAHLAAEVPSLSIRQGGTDYAIATISEGIEAFPLKFRSIVQGDYTLTVNTESGFDYLHLIDKVANRDIDLLSQPTYTFKHAGSQPSDRFTVRLSPEGESASGIFAYQNGDRIVVEGTGTLQVYDVLGRQLLTHEINSQLSIPNSQFPSTGVYILRLNGMAQKIVIK